MKIFDVIADVGSAALSSHPLGALVMTAINAFLPDGDKLQLSDSGDIAVSKIDRLDLQAQIELSKLDLERTKEQADADKYKAMCSADAQETRAKIVNKAMNALIGLSIVFVLSVAYVYGTSGADLAFSFEMATVFITVSGTFAYVVRAYFGDLRNETQSRHASINGLKAPSKGLAGIIEAIKSK
ncbi:hypothetical protein [Gayadomonas joobiniege]|uniref:hypothetical protein n=1 Tax=Gayadomonas joobiniege TaxID=1234606 RepID=UPI000370F37E|nr:hypothetical protein [Gayadomonas joobiniege]